MAPIKLLVFPLDMDEAEPFIRIASALGIEIIGASSVMNSPGQHKLDHFIQLPFVTDPGFDSAFREALVRYGINTVFSPHEGVWQRLGVLSRTTAGKGAFKLCAPDPFTATCSLFAPHETWAEAYSREDIPLSIGDHAAQPPLKKSCYAALHRMFFDTPGQCDEGKLAALCTVARLLPPGDLIEIGSLYGRSALALGYLARRHRIGNVICIDPWRLTDLTNQGPQAEALALEHHVINLEQIFRIFLSTAAMLDNVGYIRNTSARARPAYDAARRDGYLDSSDLGRLSISPQVSLVHIDGNHRYDHVKRDVEEWSPYLVEGGWLLLDDYLWAFGDGPKRVGDELLASPLYDTAFVSGDTLFMRRTAHPF